MGQVLHGRATTTATMRCAIQDSQESLKVLAVCYGINPGKTVAKWKKQTSVDDLPTRLKQSRSTVLSIEDETVIVAFRKHTRPATTGRLLHALQSTIPYLTRSSLHRCFRRHGISKLSRLTEPANSLLPSCTPKPTKWWPHRSCEI